MAVRDTPRMADYTIFRAGELSWEPRGDDSGREVARLSDQMTRSRANLWRYPPGARGKRHSDPIQEEVFVVLDGTLTVDLGEPPERHELPRGSVLVVQPGTALQLRTRTTSFASSSTGHRPSVARRPSSTRSDGRLLGAGLVAGVAVHDRRQHEIEGTTRVGRHRYS